MGDDKILTNEELSNEILRLIHLMTPEQREKTLSEWKNKKIE